MQDTGNIIALLIDAENVSPKYIKAIVDEVAVYGTPAYKRIYGDWTSTDMCCRFSAFYASVPTLCFICFKRRFSVPYDNFDYRG